MSFVSHALVRRFGRRLAFRRQLISLSDIDASTGNRSVIHSAAETPATTSPASPPLFASTHGFAAAPYSRHMSSSSPTPPSSTAPPHFPLSPDDEDKLTEAFSNIVSGAYELLADGREDQAEELLRRGAEHAEESLGGGVVVAPLWDQLSIIQFMYDKPHDARESAQRAYDALWSFSRDNQGSAEAMGAAGAAAVRFASTLLACRNPAEAAAVLEPALAQLEDAVEATQALAEDTAGLNAGEGAAAVEPVLQLIDKFGSALGEGRFYMALARLGVSGNTVGAQGDNPKCVEYKTKYGVHPPSPADVEAAAAELEAAMADMTAYMGNRHPLAACALREHNRLTEAMVDCGLADQAEALYEQAMRLFHQFDPEGEEAAALGFQLGTLQYAHDRAEAAVLTLRKALAMLDGGEGDDSGEHGIAVRHRLAIALAATRRFGAAREALDDVAPELEARLGADNPMTHELEVIKAWIESQERGAAMGAEEAAALLDRLDKAVAALDGFGPDHMLAEAAKRYAEEARRALHGSHE